MHRIGSILGGAALALVAGLAAPAPAQQVTLTVENERLVYIAENRRNPGETAPLALGDLNGDGAAELILGAPRAPTLFVPDSGYVYVRYGGDYRLNGADPEDAGSVPTALDDGGIYFDLTAPPDIVPFRNETALLLQDSFGQLPSGVQVAPERNGEFFGAAVAAGDFNGDGFADLAISASNASGGAAQPGAVYLLLGRADLGLDGPKPGFLPILNEITAGRAAEIKGRAPGERFGEVLLFADLDDDGLDDLVIGTPRAANGGTVDVLYGAATLGFTRSGIDAVPLDHTRILTNVADERLGRALAAGDLDGDAERELLVGAPQWPNENLARGRVLAFRLVGLRGATINLGTATPYLEARGAADGAGVGNSVVVDDIDGDNLMDVAIGAPFANAPGAPAAGAVYVLSNANQHAGEIITAATVADTTIRGLEENELFGFAMASGAYERFVRTNLVVGSPGASSVSLADTPFAGAVTIFRSNTLPLGEIARNEPDVPITLVENRKANFRLGAHVALGNFDGRFEVDLFASGNGLLPFAGNCGSSSLADWQACHDAREGLRTIGLVARTVEQPENPLSASGAWLEAP